MSDETAYQHARRGMRCPKCGTFPTSERHYPDGYGECDKPVDRHYCAPCDVEWWAAWPAAAPVANDQHRATS